MTSQILGFSSTRGRRMLPRASQAWWVRISTCGWFVACLAITTAAFSQNDKGKQAASYPPRMAGSRAETYKKVGDVELKLYVYEPTGHRPEDARPAIVFFFGGGWQSGTPEQFRSHCEYLASRGMIAIAADYRVGSRHRVKPTQCVADAKSAIRFVRSHARQWGIDPQRIAAGGGSAGGHLAAATATLPGYDELSDDAHVSSRPNALVLFNPALVLAPLEGEDFGGFGARSNRERLGGEPESLSPAHHIVAGASPAIIFHGRADSTVPFATAEAFCKRMKASGNRCELSSFPGQPHGFFNYGREGNKYFRETTTQMDRFLASLGYLTGEPTVEAFLRTYQRH